MKKSLIYSIIAFIVLWLVSKKNDSDKLKLDDPANEELTDVAYRTWLFFDTLLTAENNYLIPDNYQVNREIKEDYKTSPTDIGMSITSVISACELGFIKREKAIKLLTNIIGSIEKLEKWNGLIYNWYNIKSMKNNNTAYVNPHILKVKGNDYLILEECEEVFINGYNKKIKLKDLENYLKNN